MGLPSEADACIWMGLNVGVPKYARNVNSYLNIHPQCTSYKLAHTHPPHTHKKKQNKTKQNKTKHSPLPRTRIKLGVRTRFLTFYNVEKPFDHYFSSEESGWGPISFAEPPTWGTLRAVTIDKLRNIVPDLMHITWKLFSVRNSCKPKWPHFISTFGPHNIGRGSQANVHVWIVMNFLDTTDELWHFFVKMTILTHVNPRSTPGYVGTQNFDTGYSNSVAYAWYLMIHSI